MQLLSHGAIALPLRLLWVLPLHLVEAHVVSGHIMLLILLLMMATTILLVLILVMLLLAVPRVPISSITTAVILL